MVIDEELLNKVSAQAKVNERLRMNFNLHDSLDAKAQRLLNALEIGTIRRFIVTGIQQKLIYC